MPARGTEGRLISIRVDPARGTGRHPHRPMLTVWVLSVTCLVASLSISLIIPLLPTMPQQLDTSPGVVTWLVTVTVLTGSVANPLLGRLGDQFGLRRVLFLTLCVYVVGSLVCAVPAGFWTLLLGRALQGAAVACVPLGISLMGAVLPSRTRAIGIALSSAMMGVGGAVGIPIAGWLSALGGLLALFLVIAVCGMLAAVAVLLVVPSPPPGDGGTPVDLVGSLLLAGLLVLLLLALSRGSAWGWLSPATLGTAAAGVGAALVFGRLEMRRRHPVVDLRLAATRAALLTNVASMLIGFVMFVTFLGNMQVLQGSPSAGYGLGLDLVTSGLVMLPGGVLMAAAAPLASRMVLRMGARATLFVGSVVLAVGSMPRVVWPEDLWQIVLTSALTSVGIALAYAALPALVLDITPPTRAAAANGLNALARGTGTALAAATLGSLLGFGRPGIIGFFAIGAAVGAAAVVLVAALRK